MKHEEIERLLAELPHQQPRASAPSMPSAPSLVFDACRALARRGDSAPATAPTQADRERERQDGAKRRAEAIRHERARIERRSLHPRLVAALKSNRTPCVLLLGPTSIGKTSAMHWLAAEWPGYHVHARELASSERRHGLGEGYPPELERARRERVLYLDDVGAEEPRDLGALQFLLDARYSRGLAIVATSGLKEQELLAHLGAPYLRRITDQHVARKDGSEWPVLIVDGFGWSREDER
jgi:hypothetical protein